MKKSSLVHLAWALIAGATFFLGSEFMFRKQDRLSSGKSANHQPGQRFTSGDSSSSDNLRTRSSRAISSSPSGDTSLTDVEISALGEAFRKAKGPIARRLAFAEILKNLTSDNALLLRAHIVDLPQDSSEFRDFHYAWGAIAGPDAIDHGSDTPERDLPPTLAGWASADPEAALAYFHNLPPEERNGPSGMKWGAIHGLADADPKLAAEFALQRLEEGDNDAYKMIHLTADAILRFGDLDQAAEWSTAIPKGPLQTTAVTRVAKEMASNDPAEAYQWTNSLPNGSSKFHAIGATFEKWAERDPEEAARILPTLPEKQLPSAIYGYASRVAYFNPEAGVEWANSIKVEKTRVNALIDTGRTYYKKDREGALAWLATSNLTPEQRERIVGGR